MAVETHLGIAVAEYDKRIRTFVPYYAEMLDVSAAHLRTLGRDAVVVELGTGSGALATRVLAAHRHLRVIGIDVDPAMLGLARGRAGGHAARLEVRQGNFVRLALPRCQGVMASLALHHVRSPTGKAALYARIANALDVGGLLVSADCMPPSSTAQAELAMAAWRAHLRGSYSAREAASHLRTWSKEDRYQTLDTEQRLMERAGFTVDIVWRRDAFAVVVGTKSR